MFRYFTRLVFSIACALLVGCDRAAPPEQTRTAATEKAFTDEGDPWFTEVASSAGLAFRHSSGHRERFLMPEINTGGVGLLDFDNDGRIDIFCVSGGMLLESGDTTKTETGNRLYRNVGDWQFEDVTMAAGVGANTGYGMGVACADYDRDGWTDLYLLNLGTNVLYRNLGNGTFTNVTAVSGTAGDATEWSSSAAFFDADNDGNLDLFVVNYLHWSLATEVECYSRGGVRDYCSPLSYRAPAKDRFFRNLGDGTFEDLTVQMGIDMAFGNGLGVATGDFNNDGRIDVFVANDATANQLWLNHWPDLFSDEALLRGAAFNAAGVPRAGMGAVAVDVEQKGTLDLFVTHLMGEGNGWFANSHGLFADRITPDGPMVGSRSFTGFGLGFRDFDHDGNIDVFLANGRVRLGARDIDSRDPYAEPNTLLRGKGGGKFQVVTPTGGTKPVLIATSRGAGFGDFDNDGAEDIVIINKDGPVHLLRNIAGGRGHWIGLDVRSRRGPVAPNALVQLSAGGKVQYRQVQPNEGYASSQDPRLVFGLGEGTRIESISIRWTDGSAEKFEGLAADRYHLLRQGTGRSLPAGSAEDQKSSLTR